MIGQQRQIDTISDAYKNNKGIVMQTYIDHLNQYFGLIRIVVQNKIYPPHLLTQRVICLAILKAKSIKYKQGEITIESLVNQFRLLLKTMLKNQQLNANQVKNFCEVLPRKVLTSFNQINSFGHFTDLMMCQSIKAAANKRQKRSLLDNLFGSQKKPQEYNQEDHKLIMKHFGQKYYIFDYDMKNQFPSKFVYDKGTSYILKVKNEYYLLSEKSKSLSKIRHQDDFNGIYFNQTTQNKDRKQEFTVKIVKKQIMSPSDLQKIFMNKPDSYELAIAQTIIQGQKTQQNRQTKQQDKHTLSSSKFFPIKVKCCSCNNTFTQFQCLTWNYNCYCQGCLISPHVNTSHIPDNLINKYFKQRKIEVRSYKINCPECEGLSVLKNYKPTKKPTSYTCQVCTKKICMRHLTIVQNCFCQCTRCQMPTISVPSIHLNVCKNCRTKFCLLCRKSSRKFCNCVCHICLQQKKQDHQCRKKCHACLNEEVELRICKCSLLICYGCYYHFLSSQDGSFCYTEQYD